MEAENARLQQQEQRLVSSSVYRLLVHTMLMSELSAEITTLKGEKTSLQQQILGDDMFSCQKERMSHEKPAQVCSGAYKRLRSRSAVTFISRLLVPEKVGNNRSIRDRLAATEQCPGQKPAPGLCSLGLRHSLGICHLSVKWGVLAQICQVSTAVQEANRSASLT